VRWSRGAILSALWLAGCTTVPPLPPPSENPAATWQARQVALTPLTHWTIQGRLALRTADEGGQAALNWVRDEDRHTIDITGPLGRGHMRLTQDRDGAELRDADQKTWRAPNAQQLLFRTTGWLIPLDGLNYWMLGLPAPEIAASQDLDEWGRLKTLRQSGWDIRFLEYTRIGTVDLPSKLFVKKLTEAADGNDSKNATVEVRLLIEHWALN
jgi:outer membrane lipoprotein LolB